jgi:hypothetical protein
MTKAERDAQWTRDTGHVQDTCTRKDCDGTCISCTLSFCSICGGLEGSLLPTCPGRPLSFEEDQANYRDYCLKRGPFAEGQS